MKKLADRASRDEATRSESGDTLIEVLLALVILGLTSVALILAFSTSISASATQRQLASANIALNDYTQNVIAGIESNQDLFTCPQTARTPANYMSELAIPTTPATVSSGLTTVYTTAISNVEYWNESTSQFTTTCVSNAAQEITVTVTSGSAQESTQFVVDSPSSGSSYVGGAPTALTFITPVQYSAPSVPATPITSTSGAALSVNPEVEVLFGSAPDATDLSPINLTLASSTGGATTAGTLSGCSSNDLNGEVTYTGCTITLSGGTASFTLVATTGTGSSALTATSGVITVSGSTASYLSFVTQPQGGVSGQSMTTDPKIEAFLAGTNTIATTVTKITLTTSGSSTNTPQLSSCGGTNLTVTEDANGVVTATTTNGGVFAFTGCNFSGGYYVDSNTSGVATPYTMTASAPNVISATSAPFAVTSYGTAKQMEFVTEPTGGMATSTTASSASMNSFQVAIEDSWGNIVSGQGGLPSYSGTISAKIGSTALTCTPALSQGIFTFSGCSATIGSNLTVAATATGGVTSETSSTFNVTGPVASLVWYTPPSPPTGYSPQPVAGASGSVMTNQPVLAYEDAGHNPGETGPLVVTADTTPISYTSSYASGTKSAVAPNGVLSTCSSLPPINGVISAGNCSFVGLVGTNYTMQGTTTSGTTITSPVSSTFSPTGPGPATQLVFSPSPAVEPVPGAAGSAFTTEPVIVVEDAGGNIVANASNPVEMNSYLYDPSHPTSPSVQSGTLSSCSTLAPDASGDVSLLPVSGYVDVEGSCAFGGVIGTNYVLYATSSGLTSAVSSTFTPATYGPATQVVVSGCASGVVYHATCTLTATVEDAWGNTVTSYNSGVTWSDVGGAGAVTGATTSTAVNGVSTITVTGSAVGLDDLTASADSFTSSAYGFTVSPDTTTTSVSEVPTSVTYGHESAAVFTVTVLTGHGEILPSTDSATVSVGGATCVASIIPSGGGGVGTCSIGNTAAPTGSSYTVSATYPGDQDLLSSVGTAVTGLSITADATTTTVSESPTSVVYGNESASLFTVNVATHYGEILPSSDTATVNVNGTTCVATITPSGSGGSGTCSIANNTALVVGTYAVSATYNGDTDLLTSNGTAGTGLTVTKDTTTATVSVSPTSVAYGSESAAEFMVTVVTHYGEVLPGNDTATVTVNGQPCTATVAPAANGGVGFCQIGNMTLAPGTNYAVTATYNGDNDLGTSNATASTGLTVTKGTPTITWANPTAITYGTALSGTQLNATASVAGTIVYSPVSGTVLTAGNQTLSLTFTPTNTTDYSTATDSVTLVVNKATPTFTWANPAAITYGTALSATQLNATASVPGTITYTPAAGTVLTGGSQTLSLSFTPTDTTDYSTATDSVPLTVNEFTPTVTITKTTNPTAIGAGTLTITATVAGTGTVGPTGSLTWTTSGGFNCTSALTVGSGSSTASCTVTNPGVGVYTSQVTYTGASDPNYAAATSTPFDLALGASSATDLSTTSLYYLIDGSTAGFSSVSSSDNYLVSSTVTITSLTGIITPGYTSGTTPSAIFTVGQGQNGFSNLSTPLTCSVTTTSPGTTCTSAVSDVISTGTYIDLKAQQLAGGDTFKAMWIVAFT